MPFKVKLKRSLSSKKKISELKKILNLPHEDIAIGNSVDMVFNHLTLGRGVVIVGSLEIRLLWAVPPISDREN